MSGRREKGREGKCAAEWQSQINEKRVFRLASLHIVCRQNKHTQKGLRSQAKPQQKDAARRVHGLPTFGD
jgi:hypothetical protein